ncbi:membrane associated rhomboid family serine protease [Lewinella marina]|uniref:VanZ family protein n=1 Tax=Neolewinella marina TaxID=438751 RepID=A0A2G0CKE5_9BACT|nr:VanZ family protein [Neolewinella marina]NJB84371.1 membrane associated rhomboid family serine protease [Neolewinella marina]PHL00432.1 VanZ family protein [Neolewinella marina]
MWPLTSRRERRLWLWTLAAVAAIFATLGLAGALADAVRGTPLNVFLFLTGCLLVSVTVVTQGLRSWPGPADAALIIGIATAYFMILVRMTSPVERSHLIEYGVVAVFILEALRERKRQGVHVPVPALLAILLTTAIGVVDELLQLLIPARVFDPVDMVFNAWAAIMAVGVSLLLSWWRKRRHRKGRAEGTPEPPG